MRPLNEIIIHCTATKADWATNKTSKEKVNEVRRWHKDKGWSDIGYHFLIDRDGTVIEGRPLDKVGAHVKGHNTGTIGISLFGGHGASADDNFYDNFTEDQERSLKKLISDLQDNHPSITKITGHNVYARKACPGFDVDIWLATENSNKQTDREPVLPQDHKPSPLQSLLQILQAIFASRR